MDKNEVLCELVAVDEWSEDSVTELGVQKNCLLSDKEKKSFIFAKLQNNTFLLF